LSRKLNKRGESSAPQGDPLTSALRPFRLGQVLLNSGQLLAGRFVAGFLQFAAMALIARHLGAAEFGYWGYALGFVSFLAAATDLGLSTLVMRDLSLRSTKESAYLGTAILLKVAICILAVAGALLIERVVNDDGEARILIWLLGFQMLIFSMTDLLYAMFRAREKLVIEAALRTGQGAAFLVVVVLLTLWGAAATAIAGGYIAVSMAGFGLAVRLAHKSFQIDIAFDSKLARRLLAELWPLGTGVIMTTVYYYFDRVYMGSLGQTEAVGWYTAAYTFAIWVAITVTALRNAFLPAQSRALIEGNEPGDLLNAYGRVSVCAAITIGVSGVFFARPLLGVFFGREFEAGTFALQMLMITGGFMFLSSFYGSHLIVLGRQRLYLAGVTLGAVANVSLNLFLIPRYSLDGAAAATLASEAVVFLSMFAVCSKLIPQLKFIAIAWVPLRAAAVLAAVFLLASLVLPTTVAVSLAMAAFLAAALRFGLLRDRGNFAALSPSEIAA
jgi:O-antigen/teichoic acid export membrane protein